MNPPVQKPYFMTESEKAKVRALIKQRQEQGLIEKRAGIADDYIKAVERQGERVP